MSLFHGLIETKNVRVGDGRIYRQRKFYCSVHGWFDLFVFPDSETEHEQCRRAPEACAGAGLELPKVLKKAA